MEIQIDSSLSANVFSLFLKIQDCLTVNCQSGITSNGPLPTTPNIRQRRGRDITFLPSVKQEHIPC